MYALQAFMSCRGIYLYASGPRSFLFLLVFPLLTIADANVKYLLKMEAGSEAVCAMPMSGEEHADGMITDCR